MGEIVRKATIGNNLFLVLAFVAIVAFIASWLMPPTGVVDSGTIEGIAWLFAFAGLDTVRHAIDRGIDARFQKGDTSIEFNNPDAVRTATGNRCGASAAGTVEEINDNIE